MRELKDFMLLAINCRRNISCDDCSENCEGAIDEWLEWLAEHDKQIRADAIEEMANVLINGGLDLYDDEIREIWEIAEQLKEQKNE